LSLHAISINNPSQAESSVIPETRGLGGLASQRPGN